MEELIARVTTRTGLDAATAQTAIGHILAFLQKEGPATEVSQLLSDPSDATHLVLRSNFGLLTTRDTGQNWDLVCEGGIGYQNLEPAVALLGDGSLIAALSSGIAHGDRSACNFGLGSGVSAYVADVSRVPGTPTSAVAVSVDPSAGSSDPR